MTSGRGRMVGGASLGLLLVMPVFSDAEAEPVQLATSTGRLHGTLDVPEGRPRGPVVLIIAGSGPTDRDGNQPSLRNDSLKQLGQALARRGIAALRHDKRGVGASVESAPREADLRFETYVDDATDWVRWLRNDPRFTGVGVIGHSEGALIGALAAKRAPADAFVSVAGAGRPAATLISEQLQKFPVPLRREGERIVDELLAGRPVAEIPDELAAAFRPSVQPYLISWFRHDPVRETAAVQAPVLVLHGSTDVQVPVDDARRLAAARSGAVLRVIDGMNHVLKRAVTADEQRAAYTDPSVPIDARAVDEVSRFLTQAFQPPRKETR